jgi:hypothetical protein
VLQPGSRLGPYEIFSLIGAGRAWARPTTPMSWTRAVPDTQEATNPFFSPDGRGVGFWADGMLRKISVAGGPPVDLGRTPLPIFAMFS